MDQKSALEYVRSYRQALIKLFPEAKTYLFGSHAKGNQRDDSDIDVAVILPHLSENYLWNDVPRLWRLTGDINPDIEPVMLELDEDTPLYREVITHGILIQ